MSGDERDRMAEVLHAVDCDCEGGPVLACPWQPHFTAMADALLAAGFGDTTTRDAALAVAIEERDAARVMLADVRGMLSVVLTLHAWEQTDDAPRICTECSAVYEDVLVRWPCPTARAAGAE